MNDQNEKLSALLDDYQSHDNQDDSLLTALQKDVNQQYTLQRYQLIGDVLRNEVPEHIRTDFAADVIARIRQEPALQVEKQSNESDTGAASSGFWSWFFKPAAGVAVAAAVAVITVSTLQKPESTGEQSAVASADASQAKVEQLAQIPVIQNAVRVSGNPQVVVSPRGMNWKVKRSEPALQLKLNNYLINHNEYSNSIQGIIPQARVVGFDGQR
jgi:negative regulator of sigma E activity